MRIGARFAFVRPRDFTSPRSARLARHKETKKRRAKERAEDKLKLDDSMSTVLEEDEELGRTDSSEGLQSLLDNVEDLLEEDAASGDGGDDAKGGGDAPPGTARVALASTRSVQESLRDANAPRELRQATAVLLAGNLLDETTARLLTNDIMELEAGSREDVDGGEGQAGERIPVEGESEEPREDPDGREDASAIAPTAKEDTRPSAPSSPPPPPPSSESTVLLPASPMDEMLRPSIFTMNPEEETTEPAAVESLMGGDATPPSASNRPTGEDDAKPPESNSLWSGVS